MRTHLTRILVVLCVVTASLIVYISAKNETFYKPSEKPNEITTIYKKIESHNNDIIKISKQLRSGIAKPSEEAKVLQAAVERKKEMLALISKNPTDAMKLVIRKNDKEIIPEKAKQYIEDETEIGGKIAIYHADLENNSSSDSYKLETSAATFDLAFAHSLPLLQPKSEVKVTGAKLDNTLLAIDINQQSNKDVVLSAQTPTVHKTAVILFNFANNATQSATINQVRDIIFSNPNGVNQYLIESSYGGVNLTGANQPDGDIYGWYTISQNDGTTCDYGKWTDEAKAKALADGFDPSKYNHIIYTSVFSNGCKAYTGFAIGASFAYINGFNPLEVRGTAHKITHEIGHNLGLAHAHMLSCKDQSGTKTSLTGACDLIEYGDSIDRMGAGIYTYNNVSRNYLHYFSTTNTQTITQSGDYIIYPVEAPSNQVQLLKIPRSQNESMYIEFRQPFGIDNFTATSPLATGVSVRLGSDTTYNSIQSSTMIDTTPTTATNPDGLLLANQTLNDPVSGASITLQEVNPQFAKINVQFNQSTCTVATPSISITPATQSAQPGQAASYTVSITNNDSTTCLPSYIEWQTRLHNYQTQSPDNKNGEKIIMSPGQTVIRNIQILVAPNALGGLYPFEQVAHHYPNIQYETIANGKIQVTPPELPYYGTPLSIPGTIQAEDFDTGGELTAYHDNETANLGGQYRTIEGVDISTTQDVGGGFAVSSIRASEWMKYTVNIAQTGNYTVNFRVALSGGTSTFHMEVDDQDVTGLITIPNTRGWDTWTTLSQQVSLPAGTHILKLVMDTAAVNGYVGNINYISFDAVNQPTSTPTPTITNTPTPTPASNPPQNTPTPTLTPTPTQPVNIVDNTPPTLTIKSPASNATIGKYIVPQLAATASDTSGIQSITITIDGTLSIKTCNNTTNCNLYYNLKSGNHTITFKATDKATPVANTSTKTITVRKM